MSETTITVEDAFPALLTALDGAIKALEGVQIALQELDARVTALETPRGPLDTAAQ